MLHMQILRVEYKYFTSTLVTVLCVLPGCRSFSSGYLLGCRFVSSVWMNSRSDRDTEKQEKPSKLQQPSRHCWVGPDTNINGEVNEATGLKETNRVIRTKLALN